SAIFSSSAPRLGKEILSIPKKIVTRRGCSRTENSVIPWRAGVDMLTRQFKVVGAQPTATVAEEQIEALSDEELLDRFLTRDDPSAEAAFRAIIVRHGPMVLGVCRHILNQIQDAEDAFQATFLVLARKAGSIRDRRVLARWLYEVAYRIAMRARANGVRRRAHERQGGEMAATVTIDNQGWIELKPVLHE